MSFPTQGWMTQPILLSALGALAFLYRYGWLASFQVSSRPREAAAFGLLPAFAGGWAQRAAQPGW